MAKAKFEIEKKYLRIAIAITALKICEKLGFENAEVEELPKTIEYLLRENRAKEKFVLNPETEETCYRTGSAEG